jgi:predicted NBD/HSP70 family sugar kinase
MTFVPPVGKATTRQLREHNRQLVLRAVYTGTALSRVALAQQTGLTKPTVSELVTELIAEGLLLEDGFGDSTEGGGKRPRLLRFLPDARQVIGISVNFNSILGVLTHLDGHVIAEHTCDLRTTDPAQVIARIGSVINGLIAQLSAPLVCIGIGIAALVDESGMVRYAPRFEWRGVALGSALAARYTVPITVNNSSELAAMAQYAFGGYTHLASLAAVMISNSIGVGAVLNGAMFQLGSEIGYLHANGSGQTLQDVLGWANVQHSAESTFGDSVSYLHISDAAIHGDANALALMDTLAGSVAQVVAQVIALLHPDHIAIGGKIADLGEPFLQRVIAHTRGLVLPEFVDFTTFSIDDTPNLVAIGAAARSVQTVLGLV